MKWKNSEKTTFRADFTHFHKKKYKKLLTSSIRYGWMVIAASASPRGMRDAGQKQIRRPSRALVPFIAADAARLRGQDC